MDLAPEHGVSRACWYFRKNAPSTCVPNSEVLYSLNSPVWPTRSDPLSEICPCPPKGGSEFYSLSEIWSSQHFYQALLCLYPVIDTSDASRGISQLETDKSGVVSILYRIMRNQCLYKMTPTRCKQKWNCQSGIQNHHFIALRNDSWGYYEHTSLGKYKPIDHTSDFHPAEQEHLIESLWETTRRPVHLWSFTCFTVGFHS